MKRYRMVINGREINVCPQTLNVSRKRCLAFLNSLLDKTKTKYGSSRLFWSDIIMLNMLTNRILYHSDPSQIEKALSGQRSEKHD